MKGRRKDALAAGDKFYFTGKPCKRGHVVARHACDGQCSECKKTKPVNSEKAAANVRAYYKRNAELVKAKRRASYAETREESAARAAEYRKANPERWAETRARSQVKRTAAENARRARKISATPVWLTNQQKLEIEQKYLLAKIHEMVTGMAWEVDHIAPLRGKQVCGMHVPWNLQVILETENRKKGAKWGS